MFLLTARSIEKKPEAKGGYGGECKAKGDPRKQKDVGCALLTNSLPKMIPKNVDLRVPFH